MSSEDCAKHCFKNEWTLIWTDFSRNELTLIFTATVKVNALKIKMKANCELVPFSFYSSVAAQCGRFEVVLCKVCM